MSTTGLDLEATAVKPGDTIEAKFNHSTGAYTVRGVAIPADPTKMNPTFMFVGRDTIACYGRAHHTLASVRVVKAAAPVFKVGDWVEIKTGGIRGVVEGVGTILTVRFEGRSGCSFVRASGVTLSTMPEPPKGSVILDKNGEAWQRGNLHGYWHSREGVHAWDTLLTSRGPVTVLHRGKSA